MFDLFRSQPVEEPAFLNVDGSSSRNSSVSARLGIPSMSLDLQANPKRSKRWRISRTAPWESVEFAALRAYRNAGWKGDASEGRVILNVIKLAAFPKAPADIGSTYAESFFKSWDQHPWVKQKVVTLGKKLLGLSYYKWVKLVPFTSKDNNYISQYTV